MAEDTPLLAAFGQADFFRTAYNYDLDEINSFLDDVVAGKRGGPTVQDNRDVRDHLRDVRNWIMYLSLPQGANYLKPDPPQHLPRKENQKLKSKFVIFPQLTQSTAGFWSSYDLLGHFLGMMGPVEQAAGLDNYFLPMTAVYARWCSKLAGHAPQVVTETSGAGDWPNMFQCTWNDTGKYFGLGTSLAGCDWNSRNNYRWGELWRFDVGNQRFDVLSGYLDTRALPQDGWGKESAPAQQAGRTQTAWGIVRKHIPLSRYLDRAVTNH
ncbi:hypothetical protein FGRMN_5605 [Fusarium graminum]|nr:hypothetical protein FGRMN_5605 [Fusarium graminum]